MLIELKAGLAETYSDFTYIEQFRKGYIVTEEFDLIEFSIIADDELIIKTDLIRNFGSYLNKNQKKSPVYLAEYEEFIYIITNYGTLVFSCKNAITSRNFNFKMTNISNCINI